jgi:hypothetical protein
MEGRERLPRAPQWEPGMSNLTTNESPESSPLAPRVGGQSSRGAGGLLRQLGLPVLAAAVLVAALLGAGWLARAGLRQDERYIIAFADIDCPPPPGQDRGDFLGEVQYLAGLPDRLSLLDDDLAERLHQAFGRHPWTASVTRVEVVLPRQVRVELVYRTPVLAVPLPSRSTAGARVVDRDGVLLPVRAAAPGLPILVRRESLKSPAGLPGTPWGDATVAAAARIAAVLQPHEDRLRVTALEPRGSEWVLTTARGRILWGRPPGQELAEEATAEQKRDWLLGHSRQDGDLDVRVAKSLASRPLVPRGHP